MARTIFITGSNSGVGLASTKLFLSRGWNVVATARSPASSTDLQQLQEENEDRLLIHTLDLTRPETFKPAIDAGISKFGKIDVLANNAGYGQPGMLELLDMDDYRRQFEVNVFGPIDLTKAILPHFHETADPASPPLIIFTSSGAAHFALPLMSPYKASKSALDLFTESISYELAATGIITKIVVPHGGIQSTNFAASSNAAPVSSLLGRRPDLQGRYGAYVAKVFETMGSMATNSMPVTQPAEKIFEAATDGKTKLRYFVAPEDGGANLAARMAGKKDEDTLDDVDERYMNYMRSKFAASALL